MTLLTTLLLTGFVVPTLDIRDFGAVPNGDSTLSIQKAFDKSRELKGAIVYVPAGTWRATRLQLYGNTEIRGDGPTSLIERFPKQPGRFISVNYGKNVGSPDPALNEKNITVRKVRFRDHSDTEGMSQPNHILNLNGVSNVLIEDCTFEAYRGDAIYLGSGNFENQEMHNQDIIIRRNRFDGVNKKNRHPVSLIDGTRVLIANNTILRTGAIDLEPNKYKFQTVQDVTIRDNIIDDIEGAAAIMADIPFGQKELVKPFQNITITGNTIKRSAKRGIWIAQINAAGPNVPLNKVVIANNEIESNDSAIMVCGLGDVEIRGNRTKGSQIGFLLGYGPKNRPSYDVRVIDNTLTDVGASPEKSGGAAFVIFAVDKITISGNTVVNAVSSDGTAADLVMFRSGKGGGFSRRVEIANNTMRWDRAVNGKSSVTRVLSGYDADPSMAVRGNIIKQSPAERGRSRRGGSGRRLRRGTPLRFRQQVVG